MNKLYYLFPVIFFCTLALPVKGQSDLEKKIQNNVTLEKEIELLKKDSANVKKEIRNQYLQIEKDSIKNKELNRKYSLLLNSTSQESIMSLSMDVDSLQKLHDSLQASIISTKKKISEKSIELKKADTELQDMSVYSEIQKQQAYKINLQYLSQKYSHMSLEKLNELSNSIDEYKSFEGFNDYQKRLAAALNNKKLFDDAWECVSTGHGYQNVYAFRSRINALLEIKNDDSQKGMFKLTKEQYNEVDSLDIRLSRYKSGIRELQGIVSKINSDEEIIQIRNTKKASSKKDCLALMRKYVIPEENSEGSRIHARYFKMIPYLEKLLRKYWNELKDNPFNNPTKTEKTISDLIIR